jgi:hypothetical protein
MLGVFRREDAAAGLLNAQAANFDVVEVLECVPPAWPLPTLSDFLVRSLRRTVHARHEVMLVKGVSMGQNLAVSLSVLGLGSGRMLSFLRAFTIL